MHTFRYHKEPGPRIQKQIYKSETNFCVIPNKVSLCLPPTKKSSVQSYRVLSILNDNRFRNLVTCVQIAGSVSK